MCLCLPLLFPHLRKHVFISYPYLVRYVLPYFTTRQVYRNSFYIFAAGKALIPASFASKASSSAEKFIYSRLLLQHVPLF